MTIDTPEIRHGQLTPRDVASIKADLAAQKPPVGPPPPWGIYPSKETFQLALRNWCGDPALKALLDEEADRRCPTCAPWKPDAA